MVVNSMLSNNLVHYDQHVKRCSIHPERIHLAVTDL